MNYNSIGSKEPLYVTDTPTQPENIFNSKANIINTDFSDALNLSTGTNNGTTIYIVIVSQKINLEYDIIKKLY